MRVRRLARPAREKSRLRFASDLPFATHLLGDRLVRNQPACFGIRSPALHHLNNVQVVENIIEAAVIG